MVFGLFKKKKEEEKKRDEEVVGTCVVCNQPVKKTDDYKVLYFQGLNCL